MPTQCECRNGAALVLAFGHILDASLQFISSGRPLRVGMGNGRIQRQTMLAEKLALVVASFIGVNVDLQAKAADGSAQASTSTQPPQARTGFQVELVAAEPLVVDPVAFDWGPDGKLWVVEMRDYPLGMDNQGKPGGRIKVLEDKDEDGKYETATIFMDELFHPNGIMSWRNGVLVTCAPDIFYAEDSDGDGRADRKEVLFTGFGEASSQHRVNGLRWGLDNWVYCANGDPSPSRDPAAHVAEDPTATGFSATVMEDYRRLELAGIGIKSTRTGATFNMRGRDCRIRPDEGLLDPQSGQAQFGRDRDNWGNWFGCNHNTPLWHFALDDYYLRRNPHVRYPSVRVEMPPSVTFALGKGRQTGTGRNPAGNSFTSACSVMVYRDEFFGQEFANSWFVCEPVHNLVHRELLIPKGTTFSSQRAPDEANSEFLASADAMFTPVSIRTGPDGAIWVADMYRDVLEHPHWMPEGWETRLDVRRGHTKGRIYRVYPSDKQPRSWPRLNKLSAPELVDLLGHPNGWLRDKAQQLLVERQDQSMVTPLEQHVGEGQQPLGRLHALCTLHGLHALRAEVLHRALSDTHAGVRRHAVRLSESQSMQTPEVRAAVLALVADPDAMVRVQLGYSLGFWNAPECGEALGQLLSESDADPYIAAAALSSLSRQNLPAVTKVVRAGNALPPTLTVALLQSAIGFNELTTVTSLLSDLTDSKGEQFAAKQFTALAGWLDALEQGSTSLAKLMESSDERLKRELLRLRAVFDAARRVAGDAQAPAADRLAAIRLLGRGIENCQQDIELLSSFLAPQYSDEFQAAAAAAFGHLDDPDAPERLLTDWSAYTPKLRDQVLSVIMSRARGPDAILDAIADGRILSQDVALTSRQILSDHPSPEIRDRANQLFTDRVDADRDKVVVAYEDALQLEGDVDHGLRLFGKHCATCHRLGVVGDQVGPDLAMVRDKEPEWFLPAIFDPSRAVDAKYFNYVVVTHDGKALSGVLAEETSTNLVLAGATGERNIVLRENIDQLSSTGKSTMPDGFEKQLSAQDVADLIAWLRHSPPAAKDVELNEPALVRPGDDGVLRLLAGNCQIFGNEIKVWDQHQCLGWWTSLEDKAVWTFELPKAGRYSVWLDWSSDDASAGNEFLVEVNGQSLRGKVSSTGAWETYREENVGEVDLDDGISQLSVRAAHAIPPGKYLFDLKKVRLQPLASGEAQN